MRWCIALGVLLVLGACGRGHRPQAEAPRVRAVDTAALQKLVQGVEAAKTPRTRGEAAKLLEQAVAADPNLWEAHYDLGVVLVEGGKAEAAEPHLAKAFELAPNAEDVAMALAEVRRRLGRAGVAAEVLATFVEHHPEAVDARVLLAACLRDAGKYDAAIEQAREVLIRRGGDPDALSELSLAYLDQGELDTAELLSAEALKADPTPAVAERTAGLIALRRGDDAVAFRHFERASSIDPRDTTARLNMGTVLLRAGVYDKAEAAFRAVLAVQPDDVDATLGLAAALRGQGRRDERAPYEAARRLLEDLVKSDPGHLVATFNLAVLLADFLEDPAAARRLFRQYLDEAPGSHDGRAYAERRLSELEAVQGTRPAPARSPTGLRPSGLRLDPLASSASNRSRSQ